MVNLTSPFDQVEIMSRALWCMCTFWWLMNSTLEMVCSLQC